MDWNGDGHRDMLIGGFGGDITYYAGQPDGSFAAATALRFENGEYFSHKPILTEYMKKTFSEPAQKEALGYDDSAAGIWVTDWDGDGDLDIISGWFYGGLFVSRNNGTPTAPKLSAEFEFIHAGGEPLMEVFQAEPCIVDWDGDGRDDLIYGMRNSIKVNEGAVYWCRNTADKGAPVYEAPRKLVDAGPSTQYIAPSIGRDRTLGAALTVGVIDWDGDGDLDLLVGDYAGVRPTHDDITSTQYEELTALVAEGEELTKQMKNAADRESRIPLLAKRMANMTDQQKYLKPPQKSKASRGGRSAGRVWLLIRD